ncbi:unnamed protein product (macronuclear) [Paramecium tetraurelia]|uniref:Transmembrane protein n=1 Tax=Paramecium tetraurelia TaxID=5888 RepID=A0CQ55_PARTE|nr:uncharacterized protein GSPATT00009270001 [Paramecium tetraurelia]CAK72922.1 unnamed protein product [Paramecium tetraurelia]|eukprot:XP_001440319.1 hypothetical protein (macronuclear) [Paramecium tetraurelia strain d4-2]
MTHLIPYLILIFCFSCDFIMDLSQDYQIQTQELSFKLEDLASNQYFSYGLWSKYLPLRQISQIGKIGIFDSNCYHLHNSVDSSTVKIDLIYFDCLDFDEKKITKVIQFFDYDGIFHSYDIKLDQWEYENRWYFISIVQWPLEKRCELLFILHPDTIFTKILQIICPFRSLNQLMTFGGGLILSNDEILQSMQGSKQLSFFPGKLYYVFLLSQIMSFDRNGLAIAVDTFGELYICNCESNINDKIENEILIWLDQRYFTSENGNCDSFGLSGWLRIKEIHKISDNFDYQFLKMNKFSQNLKFNDDNLSAFQLLYRILSQNKYEILIMTYSYTFPIVNIDFTDNPFLIIREIEIQNDIYLWHYLQVTLQQKVLQIMITFYNEEDQYQYSDQLNVNHFNEVQFQIHYGNVNQESENYLNVQIENFHFYNCDTTLVNKRCHLSCEQCDGPTNSDCISCSHNSNRIYIPTEKACVCHYNEIDQDFCYSKEQFQIQIIEYTKTEIECEYGYFYMDSQTCIKCPSLIKSNLITCLECIFNPLNWKSELYCQSYLYTIADNTYNTIIQDTKEYYILIDDQLLLCKDCDQTNFQSDSIIYQDFSNQFLIQKEICQRNYFLNQYDPYCYPCNLNLCEVCVVQFNGLICLACIFKLSLNEGFCNRYNNVTGYSNTNDCVSPYYITSNKQCKICTINQCKFCFEYNRQDLTKCTLYKDFEEFNKDENHQVGCALCEDNFIFDFQKGYCIHQKPTLQYCLRSFINLEGIEICTLSQIDDFNIAPEIINCQKYIADCLQCVLSPQQIIKCVICKEGYKSSVKTGHCSPNINPNSKITAEGILNIFDAWVQLIQSFLMQFLPNQYYYYLQDMPHQKLELSIECLQGFQLSQNLCFQYCDSNCLQCDISQSSKNIFECTRCPLNYYRLPNRSKNQGNCLICPQLCSICQLRSKKEIQAINPYFILNEATIPITYKCLQPAPDPNIRINPILQIAKYCFNPNCQDCYQLQFLIDCSTLSYGLNYGTEAYYQQYINKAYLNAMGVEVLQIIFNFSQLTADAFCVFGNTLYINNRLREEVFSLQIIKMQIIGAVKITQNFHYDLEIQNFEVVEISQMYFYMYFPFTINLFTNKVSLIINDTTFQAQDQFIQSQFQINGSIYQEFILHNVIFKNLLISESTVFNIKYNSIIETVFIENLQIINCTFSNSKFIQLSGNPKKIIVNNLEIINCLFYNTLIFNFFEIESESFLVQFQKISVTETTLKQSVLVNNPQNFGLTIQDMRFSNNHLILSTVFITNFKVFCLNLNISYNNFLGSLFIKSEQANQTNDINMEFHNVEIIRNSINNSSIIKVSSDLISNSFKLILTTVNILNNKDDFLYKQKYYIFDVHVKLLFVNGIIIKDCPNQNIFYIFQTQDILFQNVLFANTQQQQKVPMSLSCSDQIEQNQQLIELQGFQNLTLQNISIQNHFNIDQSLISIFSNIIYQTNLLELINIQNLKFSNNILLKNKIGNLLSLITIYSEKEQVIEISNLTFIENIFNQYSDDLSISSSSLFYINSQLSRIVLIDCFCYNNMLTNSSNSFFSIQSDNTVIQNLTVKNHNIIDQQIFKKYYQIDFLQSLTQEEILLVIKSYLMIQNKGGVVQITASNFQLKGSSFENILAQSSAVLEIITKFLGIVCIKEVGLKNIQVDFTQTLDIHGSITIYSQNSQLQLELNNVSFINVYNKFDSSCLTLFPSMKQNNLSFKNIYLENKLDFQQYKNNLNSIIIQNMTIIQTMDAWLNYFTFVGTLSLIEMLKILNDNAIINVFGSSVKIFNLNVQGVLISSALQIIDASQFQLFETYFTTIQTFVSINIVYIGQSRLNKIQLLISQIEFSQFAQFKTDQHQFIITNLINTNTQFSICFPTIEKSHFIRSDHNLYSIINQLNEQQSKIGSMIFIQSWTNETRLFLNSLTIKNNDCSNCYLGMLYLDIQNVNKIKINNLFCYQNKLLKNGCVTIMTNSSLNSSIIIQNSQFIQNNGSQGSGIISHYIHIVISKCIFLNNNASTKGGAIYIESNSNQFQFLNTIIMENKANSGGGIYLDGNNNDLNSVNFNGSILQLNKALENSDNLIEIPDHLELEINSQEMSFYQDKQDGIITNILQLNFYETIQQGQKMKTSILMIPSNQQIGNYGLFNMQKLDYFVQISEISISLRNSMNEVLTNYGDSICELKQSVVSLDGVFKKETETFQVLQINSQSKKYDLGTQILQLDPYSDINTQLKIQIDCNPQYSSKRLRYVIYAKSYLCQLGEYYVDNGCQKCQSIQGYYSVTYNATKCSIFDNSKFKNITSNQINLNPGYWRPNYLSDSAEQCFKNVIFCSGGWGVSDNLCLLGHIGGLCEECDIYNIRGNGQYIKSYTNMECSICPKESINLLPFVFVFLWQKSFLSILLSVRSIEKTNQLYSSLSFKQRFRRIIFKLNQDHQSFLIKMLLNYLWIFSLIYSFNIHFPFSITFFESTSNSSYVLANSQDCYLSTLINTDIVYSRVITMIIVIICQLVLFTLVAKLHSIIKKEYFQMSIITNTILYLYLSNNATLIKQFCSLLAIRRISEIEFVQGNVSLLFNTQTHFRWIIWFILPGLILIGVGIPIFLFMLIYFRRESIEKVRFRRHICYLLNEYNKNSYFWEQIKIWKKTLIILIMIYFETNIILKASLLGLCLLLYQTLALKYKPFILNSLNILDISTCQICSISIFLASVQYVSDQQNPVISTFLQMILIILWIKLCQPFILKIFSIYYKRYRIEFLIQILNCIKKVKSNIWFVQILNNRIQTLKKKEKQIQINYGKLKLYLICCSKISLEQHKNMNQQLIPISTLRSRVSFQENDIKQLFI